MYAKIKIEKFKPAVMNSLLLFLAGMVWMCVGIVLMFLGFLWLNISPNVNFYGFAGAGVAVALLVHHFGFLKIVNINLKRILQSNDKKCVFSFIPWKSYVIIAVMATMGAILRHSVIPKPYLAIVYIGIGLALILSSFRYIRIFFAEIRKRE
jgi:hypothetical protein